MNFKKTNLIITIFFSVLTMCNVSYASLILEDLNNLGDNLVVKDTESSLEWLNLALTKNMGIGEALDNYNQHRLATKTEIESLFNQVFTNFSPNYEGYSSSDWDGLAIEDSVYNEHYEELEDWQSLFGSWFFNDNNFSYGRYFNEDKTLVYTLGARNSTIDVNSYIAGIEDPASLQDIYSASEVYALFLVKSSSVPEPSTLAIFALGIMGLASRRFKKQ